ncbi:Elongation factor g, partial [Daphnia magna]
VRSRRADREPQEPGKGFESWTPSRAVWSSRIHPGRGKGHHRQPAEWRAGRLPRGGREGHADLRFVPRSGLERKRLQDGRFDGLQGRLPQGFAGDPGADDGRGSRDPGRLRRLGDGRSVQPSRHGPGHGRHGRRWQDHQGRSSAVGNVRLLDDPAFRHPRPRHLHDGVQA